MEKYYQILPEHTHSQPGLLKHRSGLGEQSILCLQLFAPASCLVRTLARNFQTSSMLPRQHIWRYQGPRHTLLCHYGYVTHGATRVTLQVAPAGGVVLLSIFILHHLAPSFRHCDSLYIILYTYIFIVLLLMFMYDLVFFFNL